MTPHSTSRAIRGLTPLLIASVPARDIIVVHGWRDGEENALRIAGALTRRADATTVVALLCEDPRESRAQLGNALRYVDWDASRLEIIRKNSLRGYLRFLQARLVLMTHGLFGNPRPGRSRVHVLLGHGHGPKSGQDPLSPLLYDTQVATTNNAVWGRAVIATQLRDPSASVVVSGNPRDDAFDEEVDRERLAALGLDPLCPFVLWLPTHRPGQVSAVEQMDKPAARKMEALRQACAARGIVLVTKAHQLDDDRNAEAWGMHVVTSDSLREAGLSFFQLLALSAGLVSDYSSVWVDYLRTGRPFGLLFPDFDLFDTARGFNNPPIAEVAPEAILTDVADVERFIDAVLSHDGKAPSPTSATTARRLGLVTEPGATERVLDAAAEQLARQGIRGLLSPSAERHV